MKSPKVALLISGRGSNMEAIIRAANTGVLRNHCLICGVVASREDAAGIARARELGIATQVVPSRGQGKDGYGKQLLAALAEWNPDYLVLAGFMRILSADVIAAYRGRIVNIHPADTSVYQGTDGYGWAAANQLEETTITVHLVDAGIDTGPILCQEKVSLLGVTSKGDIANRGLKVEHSLYPRCLADLLAGKHDDKAAEVCGREQKESLCVES